eukprot:TRINITY_DN3539_c0_g1_i1.p1 TRINITY_DN3539_c0_g1~~TRINITY_DN3539_c0_g1_i1.p1  ORF type:complete len:886 (+),score=216.32 TRINITY_DN3539_c0_g1_i1:162-2819(+)
MCWGRLIPTPSNVTKPLAPIPLLSVETKVTIVDFTAQVSVIQTYQNIESNPIEASYEFPLAKNITISSFTAIIEGKRIEGVCKEKEKAKDTYDDAIASGHGAYLMEESKDEPDFFTVSVGNLPPGKEATIEISYVTELNFRDDMLIFGIANSRVTRVEDSPYYRPPNSSLTSVKSALSVQLQMTSNITNVTSQTHPITFKLVDQPGHASVTLADPKDDNDFELAVALAEPHKPCGVVQVDAAGRKCAMIALYPALQLVDDHIYTEIIFVVDRSGSMSGSRISQVRDCLQVFLRSLPEKTLFNIVGFGSSYQFLFPNGSEEYNDTTLKMASAYVSALTANMGGTKILPPLEAIFQATPKEGVPRQVFLLTDGEVSNTQECIFCVRKNAQTTRVFTFGIGAGASKELVRGIAEAGEGDYEIVIEGESMNHKVIRQLKSALQPAFTDLSVDWGKLTDHVTPATHRQPLLFAGSRLVLYGFLSEKAEAGEVNIYAKTAVKSIKLAVNLDPNNLIEGSQFHKLAAKKLIRDLEDKRSFLHDNNGDLTEGKSPDDVKNEVVRLSTTYGILSTYTAFVAVERRKDATEGDMTLRPVNIVTPNRAPPVRPRGRPTRVNRSAASQTAKSSTDTTAKESSALQRGEYVVINGSPCKIIDMATSKTGKHGHSKVHFVAVDIFTGKKVEDIAPSTHSMEVPEIVRTEYTLLDISDDGFASLLDSAGNTKNDLKAPEGQIGDQIKADLVAGKDVTVYVVASLGQERIVLTKEEGMSASRSSFTSASTEAPPVRKPAPTSMSDLIMNQKANGSWAIQAIGSIPVDAIKNAYPKSVSTTNLDLWMTAIVVVYLATHFPEEKVNWELVADKAKKWIDKEAKNLAGTAIQWHVEAKAFLDLF